MHGGNVWQDEEPSRWLDYSSNVRPEGPPSWVLDALKKGLVNCKYYPQLDMSAATNALSRYLGVDVSFVLPTAGGASAILLASYVPAGNAVVFTPAFSEYAEQSLLRGKQVHYAPLLHGRESFPLCESAAKYLKKDACYWLCNPSNPLGSAFSHDEILSLLGVIEDLNGYLIVDEAFIDFCPEHSARDLIAEHERLVITGSLTKSLGIPGVRLGYLCSQLAGTLSANQLPWELNCFAREVALALPEHVAELKKDADINAGRRERFVSALRDLGVFVYPSNANFITLDLGADAAQIEKFLYTKSILVRRCDDFAGIDDGKHLRIAVKDDESNNLFTAALKEALRCVESL